MTPREDAMDRTDNTRRVDRLCDRFRAMLRRRHVATALAVLVVLAVLLAGAFGALDWWRRAGWPIRLVLLGAYLAALGSAAWFALIQPMRRRWSNREVLSYLDATSPRGRDMLMDLYELSAAQDRIEEARTEQGKQLADQALAELAPLADEVQPAGRFVARAVRRWLVAAGIVAAVAVAFTVQYPDHAQAALIRLFNPFSNHRWPHRTAIAVYRADPQTGEPMVGPSSGRKMRITSDGVSVPALEKLPLVAEVTDVAGSPPTEVTLFWKAESGKQWIPEPLRVRDGAARHEFAEVGEPIVFYIEGGDYRTDPLPIHIIDRPYVKRVVVDYDYPDYAGMPDRPGVVGGEIYGLQGTRVNMTFEASMPVDEAEFVLAEDLPNDALLAVTAQRLGDRLAEQESALSLASRLGGAPAGPEQQAALAKAAGARADLAGRIAQDVDAMRRAAAAATTFGPDAEALQRCCAKAAALSEPLDRAAKALAAGHATQAVQAQKAAVATLKDMQAALEKRYRMKTVAGSDRTYRMSLQLR